MVTDFIHHNMVVHPIWKFEKFDFKKELMKYEDQLKLYVERNLEYDPDLTVTKIIIMIENVCNKFIVSHNEYSGIQIFRAMSILNYEKYKGVGIYWTNHGNKAESYHDSTDTGWIVLRALVNLHDIDWEFMLKYYPDISSPWEEIESGFGESEIRVMKGSSLLITGYDVTYPADVFTSANVFVIA